MTGPEPVLAPQVAACLGLDEVELRASSGGAGNLSFEVHDPRASTAQGPIAFLRCKLGDGGLTRIGYSLNREAAILKAAASLGFPVAPVLGAFETPDSILMEVVPGVSRPQGDEIEIVAPKYVALVAAVHGADSTRFPVTQHPTTHAAMVADLALWKDEAKVRGVLNDPLVALSARALEELMPDGPQPPALVHGDVGAGNFMCLDGEVTAMLDWELAHLGDAHEDLAWLWMRGAHSDLGDPQVRFADYEAASGRPIDRRRLDWHLVFVMWKSVVSVQSRLVGPQSGELAMVQALVWLTYDALLGAQLVRLLGGSLPLLQQVPERSSSPQSTLAHELLGVAELTPEQRVVVEYLRDSAAQAAWERRSLERDCHTEIDIEPDELIDEIKSCHRDELLPIAMVVGRAVDRHALAMPRAVRRIERAQRIGLGTA